MLPRAVLQSEPDVQVALVAAGSAALVGAASLIVTRLRRLSLHVELSVIVVTSVLAVAAGTSLAAREMYLEQRQLHVVLVICAVCGLVATVIGLLHARRIVAEAHAVRRLAAALVDDDTWRDAMPRKPVRTAELADITDELIRTGDRLLNARTRERALESSRRELVAWVSHDLRAPLAGLRALVEALEDGVAEEPAAYVKRIGIEVGRLGEMVSDLFELSRLQAGAGILRSEPVVVHDLVSDTLASLDPLARARGVVLEGSCPEQGSVEADGSALLRALANLATNGVRHTPFGGTVAIHARISDDEVCIDVTDACGGISDTVLPRVFEVGFRGSDARTPGSDSGAGLGLAIVASIVEGHGGRVEVDNLGPGCRFRMRLPHLHPPVTSATG